MTIFMVFVCFTSGEGQTVQCHPAYPRQYASVDECEAFSKNDAYLKNYLNGVRNGQYQKGTSVEVMCMQKTIPAAEPARQSKAPLQGHPPAPPLAGIKWSDTLALSPLIISVARIVIRVDCAGTIA
jgi:hypothetical protein